LSQRREHGTSRAVPDPTAPPDIFDRARRRIRRDRAAPRFADFAFIRDWMIDGITERLGAVRRDFTQMLDLGCFDGAFAPPPGANITRIDAGAGFAHRAGGIQGEEDAPHFPDASFDLIVSAGVLDTVNDLPGALALARRALRPDGLFLGAFLGGGTLGTLRSVLLEAEADRPAARVHPQVDVRSAGDLLVRAGFALPVADVETLDVRYASLFDLVRDLRGMGATSLLPRVAPLRRETIARAATAFATRADGEGRTSERFDAIFVTGWAPDPSQPKPARRGSGTTSLADALKQKG
jgi:SAM-dependent methyltransferase